MKATKLGAAVSTVALLAAAAVPAYAASVDSNSATATVTQKATGSSEDPTVVISPSSQLAGSVLNAAAGNIGMNVASGLGNQQSNLTIIQGSSGKTAAISVKQGLSGISGVELHGDTFTHSSVTSTVDDHTSQVSADPTYIHNVTDTNTHSNYDNTQNNGNLGGTLTISGNAGETTSSSYNNSNNKGSSYNFGDAVAGNESTNGAYGVTNNSGASGNAGIAGTGTESTNGAYNDTNTKSSSYGYGNTATASNSGNGSGNGNFAETTNFSTTHPTTHNHTTTGSQNSAGSGNYAFGYNNTGTASDSGSGAAGATKSASGSNAQNETGSFSASGNAYVNRSNYANGTNSQNESGSAAIAGNGYKNASKYSNGSATQTATGSAYLNASGAATYYDNSNSGSQSGNSSSHSYSNAANFSDTTVDNNMGQVGFSTTTTYTSDGSTSANLGGSAGADASGVIGLNVAAGAFNNQSNAAFVSDATSLSNGTAAVTVSQKLSGVGNDIVYGTSASINGSALSGAKGNIGVNVASGIANQQSNILSVQP